MNRTEKETFVAEFKQSYDEAKLTVVTDFIGLDVESINALRTKLREKNARMKVVKNNLVKLAGKDTALEEFADLFVGPNAIVMAFGEDPVEPAKALADFGKDHPQLKMKAGVLDGKVLNAADLETLAKLPGKEQLRAQLLGVLQAPARNLVSLMAAVPRSMVTVLKAKADKDAEAA